MVIQANYNGDMLWDIQPTILYMGVPKKGICIIDWELASPNVGIHQLNQQKWA